MRAGEESCERGAVEQLVELRELAARGGEARRLGAQLAVGDARATDRAELGQLSVGQLMRERHGERAFIAGFTTYTGTLTAASGATAGEQFDAVIHLDETLAVEPLERTSGWERGELADAYPWGV